MVLWTVGFIRAGSGDSRCRAFAGSDSLISGILASAGPLPGNWVGGLGTVRLCFPSTQEAPGPKSFTLYPI